MSFDNVLVIVFVLLFQ